MYLGCPSPRTRPPKPITLPLTSWIGNMTRFQKRSCIPCFSLYRTVSDSRISSSENPFFFSQAVRSLLAPSAKPRPNILMVSGVRPRSVKYRMPLSPLGERRFL